VNVVGLITRKPFSFYPLMHAWVSQVVLFPSSFPTKSVCTPPAPDNAPHPPPSYWFFHPNNISWGVQIVPLLVITLLHSPVTSFPLSNTLSLYSTLNVRDQVSHPHKSTGKIIAVQKELHRLLTHSQNCEKRTLASSCLSVCPQARMEQLGHHRTDFHEIWFFFLKYFCKVCWEISSYIKILQE